MANSSLVAVRDNVGSSIGRMTGTQRLTLGVAFVGTVVGLVLMSRLTGATPMGTLYADLEPTTAAAIVDQLESDGVEYRLSNAGTTIQVPTDQVYALRLDLSAMDLPGSDGGWSVLDNQGITTSEFDQRVGYQRAMEGELAKTIETIDGVSDASVHLVMPEDDLFVADTVSASASVLLVGAGGRPVSPTQVEAIVNLVASSVEGLAPDRVSVTDDQGRILAAAGDGSASVGLEGDSRMRAQADFESDLEADLEQMLSAVVGPGMAVVNVTAELGFDSVMTTTEEYLPSETEDGAQTVVAETTRNELYLNGNEGDLEAGILGIESEPLDTEAEDEGGTDFEEGEAAADGTADDDDLYYKLDERDATFATNKVITNTESAVGGVTALSVAVVVDENALDAARVGELEALVQAAAGLDEERGDTLAVSLMPMNEDVQTARQAAAAPFEEVEPAGMDLIGLIRTVGTVIVALAVLFFGMRFLRKSTEPEVVESVEVAELEGGDDAPALEAGEAADGESAAGADADADAEVEEREPPDQRLESLIANQPDDVAGVLRTWLNEADEASVS